MCLFEHLSKKVVHCSRASVQLLPVMTIKMMMMCGEESHALYPSDVILEQDLGFCRGIGFLVESLFDESATGRCFTAVCVALQSAKSLSK